MIFLVTCASRGIAIHFDEYRFPSLITRYVRINRFSTILSLRITRNTGSEAHGSVAFFARYQWPFTLFYQSALKSVRCFAQRVDLRTRKCFILTKEKKQNAFCTFARLCTVPCDVKIVICIEQIAKVADKRETRCKKPILLRCILI